MKVSGQEHHPEKEGVYGKYQIHEVLDADVSMDVKIVITPRQPVTFLCQVRGHGKLRLWFL